MHAILSCKRLDDKMFRLEVDLYLGKAITPKELLETIRQLDKV